MSKHKITLIPGDGIGPELADATKRCVDALGLGISWEVMEAGEGCIEKHKTPLPESTLESIRKNKVAIKGPITTPVGGFQERKRRTEEIARSLRVPAAV